jgi:hypothetical protein
VTTLGNDAPGLQAKDNVKVRERLGSAASGESRSDDDPSRRAGTGIIPPQRS